MNALAFDTLAYARRMEAVGFSRAQAEAMADEQGKLIDERLATKADIEALRMAMTADIEALRLANKADIEGLRLANKADLEALRLANKADLEALRLANKADLAETKADILKWVVGTLGVQTVVTIGAVAALVRLMGH